MNPTPPSSKTVSILQGYSTWFSVHKSSDNNLTLQSVESDTRCCVWLKSEFCFLSSFLGEGDAEGQEGDKNLDFFHLLNLSKFLSFPYKYNLGILTFHKASQSQRKSEERKLIFLVLKKIFILDHKRYVWLLYKNLLISYEASGGKGGNL